MRPDEPDGDVLERLRDAYWDGVTRGEGDDEAHGAQSQHLVFRVADRFYAFETRFCRQVFRVPDVIPLPQVPRHVLGIINVRGRVVSVTSPGRLLAAEAPLPQGATKRLVVVGDDEATTAMLVDCVDTIVDIREDTIQQPGGRGIASEFTVGEVLPADRVVVLLSVPRILSAPAMIVDFRRNEDR